MLHLKPTKYRHRTVLKGVAGAIIAALLVIRTVPDIMAANVTRDAGSARLRGMHEVTLMGNGSVENPFRTRCRVSFRPPSGGLPIPVDAFYDGSNQWRARLYVSEVGEWVWSSESPDDHALNGRSGVFIAEPSCLRGKLRAHRTSPRQWMTDDGATFLNLSDTAYILFRSPRDARQPVDDESFQAYVQDNVRLGISSMRAGGCGGYAGWDRTSSSNAGPRYDRSNWCWEAPYDATGANRYWERFDLDRLQTTDRRLEWLLNHYPDMYVQLIMLGKVEQNLAEMWNRIPLAGRERTIAYLLARWSAWPQVHFLIVNDTIYSPPHNVDNIAMVREIGATIARLESFGTLVSAGAKRRVDNPFIESSDWKTWHSYLHIEKFSEIDGAVCDYYYKDKAVPVHLFYGEDWYEQDPVSKQIGDMADPDYYYRRLFWSVLLSGGSPNYGGRYPVVHPYFSTGRLSIGIGGRTIREPLVGLNSIVHLRRFLEERAVDFARFEPDDGVVAALPAPAPEPHGPSRAQCARNGTDEYLIYLPCALDGERSGGLENSDAAASRIRGRIDPARTPAVRIDLRPAPHQFAVEWLRASDGQTVTGAAIEGGAYRTFTSPWQGNDVVLRLTKIATATLKPVQLIGHRGASSLHPENTLPAFRQCLRAGISIEMDVRLTGDGEPVVIHDRTTRRTCNEDWRVAERTLAELQSLDAAFRFDPKRDESFPLRGTGIKIPALREVFELFVHERQPGATMSVELKDGDDRPVRENAALYAAVMRLLDEYNLWNAAHIEVASMEEADELRSRDPRVRLIYWSNKPDQVREMLRYPHFVRIGVSRAIAPIVGMEIKAAGRKLNVTNPHFGRADWAELSALRPDALGIDDYRELLELSRLHYQ